MSDFTKAGITSGDTILVHSSLSSLGWVCGGAVAVIEALLDVLGSEGTLMMPLHTSSNTNPKNWCNPPVPESWWNTIREEMPAFDVNKTPPQHMGSIASTFWKWPETLRSSHPIGSFGAIGAKAEFLTQDHPLEPMFGDGSPIGRLYDLNGKVLLLGVNHSSNTSLHLAEYRSKFSKHYNDEGCARMENGQRLWTPIRLLALETDDFEALGEEFERKECISSSKVGGARALIFSQRKIVDFATEWMTRNRK